jgi:acyl-CoA thioester hydrolase
MRDDLFAEITLSPAFHDLDPMEVVWHGNYVKYLELARCALLQRFDYDYPQMRASGYFWPIVDLRTKYLRPVRFGQRLVVRAELVEWEFRLKLKYEIRDADTGEAITRAETIQVAVDIGTGEMCFASPPVLLQRLGVTP